MTVGVAAFGGRTHARSIAFRITGAAVLQDLAGRDLGSVDAQRVRRFGLRKERGNRVGPSAGQQILLRNLATPKHARHLGDEQVVLDEPAARRVQQRRVVRDAFRHDAVARLADDDVGRRDEILVVEALRRMSVRPSTT